MRTGLIHLTGLAATLLLLLTLIGWGDSYRTGRQFAGRVWQFGIIVRSGDNQVDVSLSWGARFQDAFSLRELSLNDVSDIRWGIYR